MKTFILINEKTGEFFSNDSGKIVVFCGITMSPPRGYCYALNTLRGINIVKIRLGLLKVEKPLPLHLLRYRLQSELYEIYKSKLK